MSDSLADRIINKASSQDGDIADLWVGIAEEVRALAQNLKESDKVLTVAERSLRVQKGFISEIASKLEASEARVRELEQENAELKAFFAGLATTDLNKQIHSSGHTTPRLGNPTYTFTGPRHLDLAVGMLQLNYDELKAQLEASEARLDHYENLAQNLSASVAGLESTVFQKNNDLKASEARVRELENVISDLDTVTASRLGIPTGEDKG